MPPGTFVYYTKQTMKNLLFLSIFLLLSQPIQATLLRGRISNNEGRIGVRYCPGNHRIFKVFPDGPAYKVGIRVDDKVLEVDGAKIFDKHWGYGEIGTTVNLTLQRKGITLSVSVTRCEPPASGW